MELSIKEAFEQTAEVVCNGPWDQSVGHWDPDKPCCVGARLVGALSALDLDSTDKFSFEGKGCRHYIKGIDAFAKLIGGNRAHVILMLKEAGAGHNPLSEAPWPSSREEVWARAARIETLPDLAGANLTGANLTGAYLADADLSGADLSGADLYRANLIDTSLKYANLTGADLAGANLIDADLSDADLSDADLTGADLSGAYLKGANLSDTSLKYANLTGADLAGANLTGAYLTGAYLSGAYLSGAYLKGAIMPC